MKWQSSLLTCFNQSTRSYPIISALVCQRCFFKSWFVSCGLSTMLCWPWSVEHGLSTMVCHPWFASLWIVSQFATCGLLANGFAAVIYQPWFLSHGLSATNTSLEPDWRPCSSADLVTVLLTLGTPPHTWDTPSHLGHLLRWDFSSHSGLPLTLRRHPHTRDTPMCAHHRLQYCSSLYLLMVSMAYWLCATLSLPLILSCLPLSFMAPILSRDWWRMLPSRLPSQTDWWRVLLSGTCSVDMMAAINIICLPYPRSGCHWLLLCLPSRCPWCLHVPGSISILWSGSMRFF